MGEWTKEVAQDHRSLNRVCSKPPVRFVTRAWRDSGVGCPGNLERDVVAGSPVAGDLVQVFGLYYRTWEATTYTIFRIARLVCQVPQNAGQRGAFGSSVRSDGLGSPVEGGMVVFCGFSLKLFVK